MGIRRTYHGDVIWGRLGIPKHKFCSWVVMQGRLQIKDRLFKIGICEDELCPLCGLDGRKS